jgi:hypothetical protein
MISAAATRTLSVVLHAMRSTLSGWRGVSGGWVIVVPLHEVECELFAACE